MTTSQTRITRRWKVAELVNKLPRMCWSSLVDWIYWQPDPSCDTREFDPKPRLRDCTQHSVCHGDVKRLGSCYCGKLRGPIRDTALYERLKDA